MLTIDDLGAKWRQELASCNAASHRGLARRRRRGLCGRATGGSLVNRYYDPTTGQFLTRDPLDVLTQSAYGYVHDNPLNGKDPLGLGCPGGEKAKTFSDGEVGCQSGVDADGSYIIYSQDGNYPIGTGNVNTGASAPLPGLETTGASAIQQSSEPSCGLPSPGYLPSGGWNCGVNTVIGVIITAPISLGISLLFTAAQLIQRALSIGPTSSCHNEGPDVSDQGIPIINGDTLVGP